jgi:decaprenyl-phosphate phosphoribosyltransferase
VTAGLPAPPEAGAPEAAPAGHLAQAQWLKRWLTAVVRTARPRQWPKNLLVFAAPLAGASLGRSGGLGYALIAFAAFTAASSAVYFVNDVLDAERDRGHPYKRHRPVAAGLLPPAQALVLAAACVAVAATAGFWIGEPGLSAAIGLYLVLSLAYTLGLKHVPVLELLLVASGFVLRALGGAAATGVPPSGWFLVVCSLGALMVAVAKRSMELAMLGADAATHRPAMRSYTPVALRLGQLFLGAAMIVAYLLWAAGEHASGTRAWHLASAVPLAAALIRFGKLSSGVASKPVEDLIGRDAVMVSCELAWLLMFAAGLGAGLGVGL